jgi:hypothetical protein
MKVADPSSPILVTLVLEALRSFETSVLTKDTCNIPEDGILLVITILLSHRACQPSKCTKQGRCLWSKEGCTCTKIRLLWQVHWVYRGSDWKTAYFSEPNIQNDYWYIFRVQILRNCSVSSIQRKLLPLSHSIFHPISCCKQWPWFWRWQHSIFTKVRKLC